MITPALPPYPGVTAEQAQCIAEQAQRFEVPELLLHAVRRKEGGKLGDNIARKFGNSRDMGPSQINSIWLSHFKQYGVGARELIGNFCVNLQASAYILKTYYLQAKGDWREAIISYNVGPNSQSPERRRLGLKYMRDVMADWTQLHSYATTYKTLVSCYYADPASPPSECLVQQEARSRSSQPRSSIRPGARRIGVFAAPVPAEPSQEPSGDDGASTRSE